MREIKVIRYFLKTAVDISRPYVAALFVFSVLKAAIPFIAVFMPRLILDELTGGRNFTTLLTYAGIAVSLTLIIGLLVSSLQKYINIKSIDMENAMFMNTAKIMMKCDYENLENPKFIDLKERALFSAGSVTIQSTIQVIPNTISAALAMIGAIAVVISFDFIVAIGIMLIVVVNFLLQRYFQKKEVAMQRAIIGFNKSYNYHLRLLWDKNMNLDSRMYGMEDYLIGKMERSDDGMLAAFQKHSRYAYANEGMSTLLTGLQTALVYGYVAIRAIVLNLGVGAFVMYIGAAAVFNAQLRSFFDSFLLIRRNTVLLEDFIKLNETPVHERQNETDPGEELGWNEFEITFRDVWFKYPGADDYVLRGINYTIKNGERISIVGRNGAGKTTFIKLLARLYAPSKGEILLNGTNINTLNHRGYLKLLSIVFQDFKIFDFTILENIILNNAINDDKIDKAAEKSGLHEDIHRLPHGIRTLIGKRYNKDGVELSGGQLQKLAIARTIYQDSPIAILDEPTAALDPLAEAKTYEKFNEIIQGKTAVYISHRLASSKFCDSILFLKDGIITESGSHDCLMRLDGEYAQMFRLQAQLS